MPIPAAIKDQNTNNTEEVSTRHVSVIQYHCHKRYPEPLHRSLHLNPHHLKHRRAKDKNSRPAS